MLRATQVCRKVLLGFDVGDAKLGTALSDRSQRIASPFKLYRLRGSTVRDVAKSIDADLRRGGTAASAG